MYLLYVFIGLVVGILVGFMGVGGVILVPAFAYILRMDQHMAQGTSMFLQLPPLGLGALLMYWIVGLWIIPGAFFGAMAGTRLAEKLSYNGLRCAVAGLVFAIGVWEASSALRK